MTLNYNDRDEMIIKIGTIMYTQWAKNLSKEDLNIILNILSKNEIDKSVLDNIDNVLFSVKMIYGSVIEEKKREKRETRERIATALKFHADEVDARIESNTELAHRIYKQVLKKKYKKPKENKPYRNMMKEESSALRELSILELLIKREIIKKSWFRYKVTRTLFKEDFKKIVEEKEEPARIKISLLATALRRMI